MGVRGRAVGAPRPHDGGCTTQLSGSATTTSVYAPPARDHLGDEPPLFLVEVALRTTIIFVYTLPLLRLLGKRGVAQLSLFQVTIIIGLGSAVGDPMFQADVPLA
ncbi:MAG: hypothetical protein BGO98_30195 [Myxococcales bacterium 68-20]|nr:hypothetical protein [Myxococcales bacterium]OJY16358.1 MAG: hypothetical protein BGO98_30195 [Myxococcales bacterium 68-20]